MRKWMRERITRRKKSPQDDKAQPEQAPLQPAYFDGEAPASSKQPPQDNREDAHGPERLPSRATTPPPMEAASREAQAGETGDSNQQPSTARPRDPNIASRPPRRRRGRGGRGRSGPRSNSPRAPLAPLSEPPAGSAIEGGAPLSGNDATVQPASSPRVPKGVVVLAIGLPGSGKSSWFKRHNIAPLSSDLLRALLFDDPTEQRFQDLVFSNLRSMLKARLIARRPLNYVDATNLTSHDRRGWIKLAQDYGYEVQAVFFDVPLEVCLERNRKRERIVSEDVMRRMAAKQKPPTFEEGFSKITVVRVKQKE